ncbi:MAG: PAS domain-containing protein, partial [Flavobacteriaceae bacterium]|nr:PAS domain-containing protein [Flavobacteriaceae bacterium]
EATWDENQLVPIYRNGQIEDVYWTFSYSAVTNLQGETMGILVTCTETTQSVLNLKMLEESEDQLRFAIEGAGLGTWDYVVDTDYLHTNRQLQEWFGLTGEENITLESVLSKLTDSEREKISNEIRLSLENNADGRYRCEFRVVNPNTNEEHYLKTIGRAWYRENSSQPYRYNGILLDITEQHKAEQERNNLEFLANASRQFIALMDIDFKFEFCNPMAKELLGVEAEKGNSILDYIYVEDKPKAINLLDKLRKGEFFKEDIRFIDNNGKPVWIHWNCVTLRDQISQEIIGYGSVSTHIDFAIKREQKLQTALNLIKEEEKRFRNLVYDAPAAIGVFRGKEFKTELVNAMGLRVMGASEEEVQGISLFEALPRLDKRLKATFQEVTETGKPHHEKDFALDVEIDGNIQRSYFNFVCSPVPHGIDTEKGIMIIAHDVTESVRDKKFIAESEKQFRNFVLQSPIAMAIIQGPELKITMANKAIYKNIWKKKKGEILGKSLLEVFPEFEKQKYPELLRSVLESGKSISEEESRILIGSNENMREVIVDYRYSPLEEIDGTISGVMVTVNDVTEKVQVRKSLEKFSQDLEQKVKNRTEELFKANTELKSSIEKLERANAELESFAYVSSHDLQEPLRKIQVFSSRIQESLEDGHADEIESDLKRIMNSATRMRNLIDDLLAFSLATDNTAEFVKLTLSEILDDVVDNLQEKIQAAEAKVKYNTKCKIEAIPYQIIQVFTNLIENSLKFTKDNKTSLIEISCETVKGSDTQLDMLKDDVQYSKIIYKDNGIGFDKKYEKRIFDLFQRLHRRDQYQGTGIGLAIVKKIIENHHGFIKAKGEINQGAQFTIYLPSPK